MPRPWHAEPQIETPIFQLGGRVFDVFVVELTASCSPDLDLSCYNPHPHSRNEPLSGDPARSGCERSKRGGSRPGAKDGPPTWRRARELSTALGAASAAQVLLPRGRLYSPSGRRRQPSGSGAQDWGWGEGLGTPGSGAGQSGAFPSRKHRDTSPGGFEQQLPGSDTPPPFRLPPHPTFPPSSNFASV